MKKLTKIEPHPEWQYDGIIGMLIHKINELITEVNRMNGFESGTVKEIEKESHSDLIKMVADTVDDINIKIARFSFLLETSDKLLSKASQTVPDQELYNQIKSHRESIKNTLNNFKKGGSDE